MATSSSSSDTHSSSTSSSSHPSTSSATHSGGTSAAATSSTPAPAARAAAQPVWLLRPIDPLAPPFYLVGVAQTVIVAAASAEEARKIASVSGSPHATEAWLDGSLSICTPLAPEEPGIIARDFTPVGPLPPATTLPVNVDVPYVQGIGAVGETLTCTMGNWDGVPTSYAYAWASDGVPNAATGPSYPIVAGDVGHSLSCIVTATNALGSTAAPPSNAVAVS